MLVEEGLVERRPYQGDFVSVFTSKQISDLYEVRKVLESLAIRLAIPRLTEESLSTIRLILDDIDAALKSGDMRSYSAADQRFHETIAQLTDKA